MCIHRIDVKCKSFRYSSASQQCFIGKTGTEYGQVPQESAEFDHYERLDIVEPEICYVPYKRDSTWDSANNTCSDRGMTLVKVTSSLVNEILTGLVDYDIWTGLNDKIAEGVFGWGDGSYPQPYMRENSQTGWSNWASRTPGNVAQGAQKDCVKRLATSPNEWNTADCATVLAGGFVCQRTILDVCKASPHVPNASKIIDVNDILVTYTCSDGYAFANGNKSQNVSCSCNATETNANVLDMGPCTSMTTQDSPEADIPPVEQPGDGILSPVPSAPPQIPPEENPPPEYPPTHGSLSEGTSAPPTAPPDDPPAHTLLPPSQDPPAHTPLPPSQDPPAHTPLPPSENPAVASESTSTPLFTLPDTSKATPSPLTPNAFETSVSTDTVVFSSTIRDIVTSPYAPLDRITSTLKRESPKSPIATAKIASTSITSTMKTTRQILFEMTTKSSLTTTTIGTGISGQSYWTGCPHACVVPGLQYRLHLCISGRDTGCNRTIKTVCGEHLKYKMDRRACDRHNCPPVGIWSDWGNWSECSRTCGSGAARRTRTCILPDTHDISYPCPGGSAQAIECSSTPSCRGYGDGTSSPAFTESDYRPSAQGIGGTSVVFIIFAICVIIAYDIMMYLVTKAKHREMKKLKHAEPNAAH